MTSAFPNLLPGRDQANKPVRRASARHDVSRPRSFRPGPSAPTGIAYSASSGFRLDNGVVRCSLVMLSQSVPPPAGCSYCNRQNIELYSARFAASEDVLRSREQYLGGGLLRQTSHDSLMRVWDVSSKGEPNLTSPSVRSGTLVDRAGR